MWVGDVLLELLANPKPQAAAKDSAHQQNGEATPKPDPHVQLSKLSKKLKKLESNIRVGADVIESMRRVDVLTGKPRPAELRYLKAKQQSRRGNVQKLVEERDVLMDEIRQQEE